MTWTQWILFVLLLAFLIWIFYLWKQQEKIRSEWKTNLPSTQLIQYTPFRLPYRIYVWDTGLSSKECISLCDLNSVSENDSFYCPKQYTKPLHELAKRVSNTQFDHHEIQIHRIVDGGSDFGYDADPETNTRIGTIVVYLNEDYEGGELCFSDRNEIIVPKRGRMVLYWTVDGHALLKESLHLHRCLVNGVQWKAIVYIHSKPFSN